MATLKTIAHSIGCNERKTQAATLPFHKAYIKADKEGQREMRTQFMCAYIAGNLGTTEDKAISILETKRDDRVKSSQAAIYRANNQFSYHIIRPTKADAAHGMTKKAKLRVYAANIVALGFELSDIVAAIKTAIKAAADKE